MEKDLTQRTLLLALLGSVALMPLLVLPIMVGGYVDHLALSDSQAGYVASAGFLGAAVAAIFISLTIHHLDLRRLALTGLCVLIVADAVSIGAGVLPVWALVVLRFLSGMGGAAAYACVMSAYAGWREPDRAYGLFMSMQFAISALGLYGLPWLLPHTGVSGVFAVFTVLDVLALLLVTQLPGSAERSVTHAGPGLEWRVIAARTSVLCLLGIGLFEACNMANFSYSERIGDSFGLDTGRIGLILGGATVLGIPAAFGVFLLGARFGRFLPIMLTALVQSAALVLLLTDPSELKYIIAMCLLSMGWAFALPYFQAIEAHIDPRGSVVVAGGFATSIGDFFGPALAASLVSPGRYGLMITAVISGYMLVIMLMRLVTLKLAD